MYSIKGQLVDILQQKIYAAEIALEDGVIQSITPIASDGLLPFILPGFIDAHVHIESSLLIPSEFARLAVVHGTVATVSDPHEIANVCGLPGVEFMIHNGGTVPFHFNFGAPSCVPATQFETAGATLDAAKVEELLKNDHIKYLSEMMNFPGVLHKDPEVLEKIAAAHRLGKPVDGHAPGLRGEQARQYIEAGISTDHECFTAEEALDKLRFGMKILIREGSAAKNFEALIGLLNDYPDQIMLCSDDKHPDSLLLGHINQLCARAVAKGIDVFKVLKAACINPVLHYKLDSGLLRVGDSADLILVKDLEGFRVLQTYISGILVAEDGKTLIPRTQAAHVAPSSAPPPAPINNFNSEPRPLADFAYPLDKWGEQENVEQVYVIEALDGQLITNKLIVPVKDVVPAGGLFLQSNPEKDILKIVVVNRYHPAPVAKSFIRNFGLRRGALASSVAHDSHNIVAIGVDDESIARAVNLVIAQKGGLSCVDPGTPAGSSAPGIPPSELILPLPVAGLMSMDDGYAVAEAYTAIDTLAKSLGSTLSAPFMTLSFMALLVIPHLKLGDLGLFDGDGFKLV
ncbi:MAG TPA: adenine deaminase [Puia sp.]